MRQKSPNPNSSFVINTVRRCFDDVNDRISPSNVEFLKQNTTVRMNDNKHTVTATSYIYVWGHEIDNSNALNVDTITFSGTARLKGGDTANYELAKQIALSKMERQYNKWISRELKAAIKELEKGTSVLKSRLSKVNMTIGSITRHIKDRASD